MYKLSIIAPVVARGAMGLFFGLLLAVSSKIFHVEQDERLPQITEVLPGANCGGCGYPGCSGFASAVVAGVRIFGSVTNTIRITGNTVAAATHFSI